MKKDFDWTGVILGAGTILLGCVKGLYDTKKQEERIDKKVDEYLAKNEQLKLEQKDKEAE